MEKIALKVIPILLFLCVIIIIFVMWNLASLLKNVIEKTTLI